VVSALLDLGPTPSTCSALLLLARSLSLFTFHLLS
jgi:hypothetical protein